MPYKILCFRFDQTEIKRGRFRRNDIALIEKQSRNKHYNSGGIGGPKYEEVVRVRTFVF